MNRTAVYLQWVKDNHPQVFAVAVRKALRKSTLGGLGDDLTSDIAIDPNAISVDPTVTQAVDNAAASQSTSDAWSGFFDTLANAVGTVAPQIVQTKAQLAQIQINQQRAAAGQPLVGSLLSNVGTAFGSSGGLMIGAIAVIGGIFLLSGRSRRA